jgi:hypothetical protein
VLGVGTVQYTRQGLQVVCDFGCGGRGGKVPQALALKRIRHSCSH